MLWAYIRLRACLYWELVPQTPHLLCYSNMRIGRTFKLLGKRNPLARQQICNRTEITAMQNASVQTARLLKDLIAPQPTNAEIEMSAFYLPY